MCSHTGNIRLQRIAFLVWSEQHVDKSYNDQCCNDHTNTECSGCDQSSDLVNAQGYKICKTTLISDCEPEPFCTVHLTLDCSHCCEARCTQKVEYQEGISCNLCHAACQISPEMCIRDRYFRTPQNLPPAASFGCLATQKGVLNTFFRMLWQLNLV